MSEEELLGHARMVYNVALRLTGDATDAEDLAQDALLRALKALPTFKGESSAQTWLYRITVNAWKNWVRSEKRRGLWKTLSFGLFGASPDGIEEENAQFDIKAEEPALDSGLMTAETNRLVQRALLSLDEETRAVVVLREIRSLSYGEIAQIVGVPEGTVKSRLSRGRDALKVRLKNFVTSGKDWE